MGLFSKEELAATQQNHEAIAEETSCLNCGMYKGCEHPKLSATGDGRMSSLIVAEANGPDEDKIGTQLVGKVGQFFRKRLEYHGIDLDKDFWKLNATNCWPHDGGTTRKPSAHEINQCRPIVFRTIKRFSPHHIWLMGGAAIQSLYGEYFGSDITVTNWRGLNIPDYRFNCWVTCLFHPSFALRSEHDANIQSCYRRDLDNALDFIGTPLPNPPPLDDCVNVITRSDEILDLLKQIIEDPPVSLSIDFETTGLKPFRPGHKIVTMSVCPMYNGYQYDSYAFPYQWKDYFTLREQERIRDAWNRLMVSDIPKVSHNIQYEFVWNKIMNGVEIKNWIDDPMLTAHLSDNRRGYTGLTFQAFSRLGVAPYDLEIKSFLKSDKTSEFNNIEKVALRDVLEYNAKDTSCVAYLIDHQHTNTDVKEFPRKLFNEGVLNLAEMQMNGIAVDEEYYIKVGGELDERLKQLESRILNGEEAKAFRAKAGRPLRIQKDVSNADLRVLFEAMDLPDLGRTPSGKRKVDEDILNQYAVKHEVEFCRAIIERRKVLKVRGTYLGQFERESVNGRIHPMYGLNIPASYRSSGSLPNFQNIPKRDEEAKAYVRQGLKASPGHQLIEADYSGVEVGTSCCYHRDPNMIHYVSTPGTDMHRDSAADIWMLPTAEVAKLIRFFAKNCWVFPQFYGSWYKECAKNLWKECIEMRELTTVSGTLLRNHMESKGITSLHLFEEHCKHAEDIFWNQRFRVYKQWKEDINKLYREQGYIESLMGFVYRGLMSFNEVSNYPIQGTAFHLLLWTLNKVMAIAKDEKWKSKFIGEIHDSMVIDAVRGEVAHIIRTITRVGTQDIKTEFPWLNVPLEIEFDVSPVDGTWYDTKEYKLAA